MIIIINHFGNNHRNLITNYVLKRITKKLVNDLWFKVARQALDPTWVPIINQINEELR